MAHQLRSVSVTVRVRMGGHVVRQVFKGRGASVDPVGETGAIVTMYDRHQRPRRTMMWPSNVVSVVLDRTYD